ncbi:MAG: DUF1569 domain-containing protein [Ferruginibacter sp.]
MKSVLEKATRLELITRINNIHENAERRWGQMNVSQMLRHCIKCEEMYLGERKYKRVFLGRLFGKIALKRFLKDDTPLKQNEPSAPGFKITETNGDVDTEKKDWATLIESYSHYSNTHFVHWFFGNMTKDEVGQFVYKHSDHHLRQFNT